MPAKEKTDFMDGYGTAGGDVFDAFLQRLGLLR
jgi:hypothetical protein